MLDSFWGGIHAPIWRIEIIDWFASWYTTVWFAPAQPLILLMICYYTSLVKSYHSEDTKMVITFLSLILNVPNCLQFHQRKYIFMLFIQEALGGEELIPLCVQRSF